MKARIRFFARVVLKKLHLYDSVAKMFVFFLTFTAATIYLVTGRKLVAVDVQSYWIGRVESEEICSGPQDFDPYYTKYNSCITSEIQALPEVKTILDVGCFIGNRMSVIHSAMPDKKITGCDLGFDQLKICRNRFFDQDDIELLQCDAAHMPFRDNTFDLVLTSTCLEHIPDSSIANVIEELTRVGKKHFLLVEAYIRHIPFGRKIQLLSSTYFYMHNYEKLLKKAHLNKIRVYGIPDENTINRYSLFLYQK